MKITTKRVEIATSRPGVKPLDCSNDTLMVNEGARKPLLPPIKNRIAIYKDANSLFNKHDKKSFNFTNTIFGTYSCNEKETPIKIKVYFKPKMTDKNNNNFKSTRIIQTSKEGLNYTINELTRSNLVTLIEQNNKIIYINKYLFKTKVI